MKTKIHLLLFAASLSTLLPLRAQIVADGATNTLSNVTNTFTGDVTVGTNGSFTLLVLSNNALLTNSANGLIGRNAGANSNEVRLISASARWRMGGSLFVGSNSAVNRLVVSNGGFLDNNNGVVGSRIDASNNLALVTGAGSLWSNRSEVTVGSFGRNNQMIVSNGGWVANLFGYLGRQSGSSNNFALVTGSGSVWSNRFDMYVGFNERSNRLVIEAGGLVSCDNGYVGDFGSASNNEALVTGPGSLWTNRSFLTIGSQAGRNRLIVSNAATVFSGTGVMGGSSAPSNQVIVTGAGSVWSNQTFLYLGAGSVGNRADVSAGGWLTCNDGYVGSGFGANSNTVTLTGSGSGWNNLGGLIVGEAGNGNVLIASNGATVLSSNATIGVNGSTANNNSVLLTGAGSLWSNRNDFVVGNSGVGNQLVVSNGGTASAGNLFVGFNSISANNRLTVDGGTLRVTNAAGTGVLDVRRGTGSLQAGLMDVDRLLVTNVAGEFEVSGGTLITRSAIISNQALVQIGFSTNPATWDVRAGAGGHSLAAPLFLGGGSSFNQMFITNGGVLTSSSYAIIGLTSGTHSNTAWISDADSLWTLADYLHVGDGGRFNRLIVTNGGSVTAAQSIVGGANNGTNCEAIITGPGSAFTNSPGALQIGSSGSTNRVRVEKGGLLSGDFQVGWTVNSVGNLLSATGPGSFVRTRSKTNDQVVGYDGSASLLIVSNGAVVEGFEAVIGYNASSSNNLALVTGAGSLWTNRNEMYVGYVGSGNQLVVSNGGTVFAQSARFLGHNSGATSNNVVTVTGSGSRWVGPGNLEVGGPAASCRLLVSGGGLVENDSGFIGSGSTASNNLAVVTGSGSVWTNLDELYVGSSGSGNQLVVSNGGTVFAMFNRNVGYNAGANSNTVTVTDAGSRWLGESSLYVGSSGAFNRLFVTNGGQVTGAAGTIGSGANSNQALVTGSGSLWTSQSELIVGESGSANLLVASNGALVVNSNGIIGFGASSVGNRAVISGAGSVWSNAANLFVGRNGSGNQLVVTNGGAVRSGDVFFGISSGSTNNVAVVTGPGSLFESFFEVRLGEAGKGNQLVVSDGGIVRSLGGLLGSSSNSSNNFALVTGSGSVWTNAFNIFVGFGGAGNQLVVSDGGAVITESAFLGFLSTALNNRLEINGGSLVVTNPFNNPLDIRRGTNVLNSGLIDVTQLLLTNTLGHFEFNGGLLITRGAVISNGLPFTVGGPGGVPATWDVRPGSGDHTLQSSYLAVGDNTSFNRLLVANGATLTTLESVIGFNLGANSNSAVIAGPGSRWITGEFEVGLDGAFNSLTVSNGGWLVSPDAAIGLDTTGSNNAALVTGAGTVWSNLVQLTVGFAGPGNRLQVSDGGTVFGDLVLIGRQATSSNNLLHVAGGTLRAQNAGGTGRLDIRSGTNRLDAGLVDVDRLTITNARGEFTFNGGTLRTAGTTIGHGRVFTVGNGASAATFELRGGTHVLLGGLTVANHASLTGSGTVAGTVTVQAGGALAPGVSIGALTFNSPPALQGATIMEISKNGATLTNDQIQVAGTLTYGGSLTVTNPGPTALTAGDRFQLFSASSFAGSFSSITLPPLTFGLSFTNKLGVDGSIEVVASATPQPTLTIQRSNNVLLVSWPTSASNFCLETAFDLKPPVVWQPVTSGITTNGSSFVFSLANLSALPKQFFRLAFPCSTAPVSLSIQLSNNLVTVSWPSNSFRLESTLSLSPPVSWQTISNGISNSGSLRTFTFTNNPGVSNQFFRLASP